MSPMSFSSSSTRSALRLRGSPWAHSFMSSMPAWNCSPTSVNWWATLDPIQTSSPTSTSRAARNTTVAASAFGQPRVAEAGGQGLQHGGEEEGQDDGHDHHVQLDEYEDSQRDRGGGDEDPPSVGRGAVEQQRNFDPAVPALVCVVHAP